MIVLADNDILFKLARCDLFDEFLTSFSIAVDDIRILKLARFSIKSKKHRNRIDGESMERLTAFLNSVRDIGTEPDPTTIAALNEQTDKNIDAGEAVLFSVCPLIPESVIVTGDKKSLAGLTAASRVDSVCAGLYGALAGRIYCFEQVLTQILNRFGFEAIRQKLIDGRECDGGMALWLGSGLDANEIKFREGLTSYLNDARRSSGILLAKDPSVPEI